MSGPVHPSALRVACEEYEATLAPNGAALLGRVRAGDVLSSATVFIGTSFLALGTTQFAWINVVLVTVWLVVAVMVGREFRRRTEAARMREAA